LQETLPAMTKVHLLHRYNYHQN